MIAALLLAAATAADLTPCDIFKSLDAYDGKMVRIRATVINGFEVFALCDVRTARDCGRLWLTYADGGPDASISFGGRRRRRARLSS